MSIVPADPLEQDDAQAIQGRTLLPLLPLRLHLQQIDAIETAIAEIDREVDEAHRTLFRTTVELLTTIPSRRQTSEPLATPSNITPPAG